MIGPRAARTVSVRAIVSRTQATTAPRRNISFASIREFCCADSTRGFSMRSHSARSAGSSRGSAARSGICDSIPALQHLGRIFYLPGADGAAAGDARAELLDAVHGWVREVLQVGRDVGQVRDELPLSLQADVTFAVLRAVDEWVVGADALDRAAVGASVPGLVLRRLLAAQMPDEH